MSKRSALQSLWAAAILLLVAGAGLSLRTMHDLRAARQVLDRNGRMAQTLRQWAAEQSVYDEARAHFERLPNRAPKPLAELAAAALGSVRVDEVREASREAAAGWVVREKEVAVSEAPLTNVMAFVQLAETQRPPWRLAGIAINASARSPGFARATLRFRALARDH